MIVALCLLLICRAAGAVEECAVKRYFELPMVANDTGSPVVSALIDDQPHDLLIDTGGFWSMLDPEIAKAFKVRKSEIEARLGLNGIPLTQAVKAPSLQIGAIKATRVDFLVQPEGYGNFAGTLGANWLHNFDIEIDPNKNSVSFLSQDHCAGRVVYWPHRDYAEVETRIERDKRITIPLVLDGKEIRALIDTGAAETYLNSRTASRLFDLTPDSPDMQAVDPASTADPSRRQYRHRFKSLAMGEITFLNPVLSIAPMSSGDPDLILGMHEMRGLHLYFAYKEGKLYATSARGDIAAAKAQDTGAVAAGPAKPDPLDKVNALDRFQAVDAALARKDYDGAMALLDQGLALDPDFAPGHVARAKLLASRGDRQRALDDLNAAIRLDPKNQPALVARAALYAAGGKMELALADADQAIAANAKAYDGYLIRGQLFAAQGQSDRAIQDLGDALRLDPKNIAALVLRSRLYLRAGDGDRERQDVTLAIQYAGEPIKKDPKNAGAYMARANLYKLNGDYEHAFADADQAVRLQPKSPAALNNRCWFGAILGRLDGALADCNAAVEAEPRSASIIDSRGYVYFRLNRYDLALADYSAALAIDPRQASSLYGRGLVKRQMGDVAGARSDMAAAEKIDPQIADHFGK